MSLPELPYGMRWDIELGDGAVRVRLRSGVDIVATGYSQYAHTPEHVITLVAEDIWSRFHEAQRLSELFGIKVSTQ